MSVENGGRVGVGRAVGLGAFVRATRVEESRVDRDLAGREALVGDEIDPWPIDQGVVMGTREAERSVGQLGGQGR